MKPAFEWKPSYSVGISSLDKDHKELLGLCKSAQYYLSDSSKVNRRQFQLVVVDIVDRARLHFKEEEALLKEYEFPELEEHVAEHAKLFEQLKYLLMNATTTIEQKTKIAEYLMDWFKAHVLETDMKYKKFLSGRRN